jgi:hypothetical protein
LCCHLQHYCLNSQTFGHTLPKIWKPQARRLQMRNPRCVKKFNAEYRRLVLQRRLPQRLYELESTIVNNYMTPSQPQESWDLDISAAECQLLAEERCRKLKMGRVQFSPATMLPRYQVAFWRIAIHRRQGQCVPSRMWSRAKKKAKITTACGSMSEEDMKQALKEAYAAFKKAKKSHIENRLSFIESFPPSKTP